MAKNYSIQKESAYSADTDTINDSIGRVWYAYKANVKISINLASGEVKTPSNQIVKKVNIPKPTSSRCFYNDYVKNTYYIRPYKDEATKKDLWEPITRPTANVHGIRLDTNLYTLEIRNNDPWVLTGIDSAPYEFFQSIAITKSEVNTIKALLTQENILSASTTFKLESKEEPGNNPEHRKYYRIKLKIIGSKNGPNGIKQENVDTGIYLYSVDQINWISAAYASEALNKIDSIWIWDNSIVPNPIGDNPFITPTINYWENIQKTGLKDRLKTIISQADNLPVANDNKGYRLLDTAIRDYIYQGNIDKVTFEMAFRLPFYIEKIKETPYTMVNGRFNNPYYTKFDEWFEFANGLRDLAVITRLNEVGKPITDYSPNYKDYNAIFQDLVGINSKDRRDYFITNQIPAYMGKNFEYENPDYVSIAHLPWPAGSVVKKGTSRDLNVLVASGVITATVKTGLENNTITYAKITDGTYNGEVLENCFVSNKIKNKKDKKFYIYKYSWNEKPDFPNSSGLTFGFGYDIGANSGLQAFKDYTGFSIPDTGVVHDAVMDALGKKRINAMHNYFNYYDSVWKTLKISFERAVSKTVPKMKSQDYLKGAIFYIARQFISNNVKTNQLYLRIYQPSFGYFYDEGSFQYLNEVEKVFLLSQSWNTGNANLNQNKADKIDKKTGKVKISYKTRARRAIHAFNTHDFRYLKYAISNSGIAHRAKILALLDRKSVFNYFQNIK